MTKKPSTDPQRHHKPSSQCRKSTWLRAGCLTGLIVFAGYPCLGGPRTTDDTGEDTIVALADRGRWDDALWMCESAAASATPGSLNHARWVARQARVLGEQTGVQIFSIRLPDLLPKIDGLVANACQGIDQAIPLFENTPAEQFLQASRLAVRKRILTAAVIASSVTTSNAILHDGLIRRITRLEVDFEQRLAEVQKSWSLAAGSNAPSKDAPQLGADQLQRLIQELVASRLSLSVLQSELFVIGSDDYRAAAADAARQARDAALSLPDDSEARSVATLLLAEALLRSGDMQSAGRLVNQQLTQSKPSPPAAWLALRVRLDLQSGQTSRAAQICDLFYQSKELTNASKAPASTEMDFARLDLLLADENSGKAVTEWINTIERRGGPFARRRAETIALKQLRGSLDPSNLPTKQNMQPALIAAQGEDALRSKDPQRAAKFLKEAALAEANPERSHAFAAKAAAAATAAGDIPLAIEVLLETARLHTADQASANLMMQAALLMSKYAKQSQDPAEQLRFLEDTLTELFQTWPASEQAVKANEWRCRIHSMLGRKADAAHAALEFLSLCRRPDQLSRTLSLWFDALSSLTLTDCTAELGSLRSSLLELADETEALAIPINREASWLLDRDQLDTQFSDFGKPPSANAFLQSLMEFRLGKTEQFSPDGQTDRLAAKSAWRLKRDALLDPTQQGRVGRVLQNWPTTNPWDQLTANWWLQQNAETADAIFKYVLSAKQDPNAEQQALELFQASPSKLSRATGIKLADQLSARQPQGSDRWFRLKLKAIRWLIEQGQRQEAKRRAAFILLTRKPENPKWQQELRSVADSS